MDAVTYPSDSVIRAMEEHAIPLRAPYDAVPLSEEYNVNWTPSLHIIGPAGKVHLENTGFLPPEEFVPWLILGRAMMHFDRDELDDSQFLFDAVRKRYPESESAPQSLYFDAVCNFKKSNEGALLKLGYEKLKSRYPSSIWVKKAYPYRLM